MKGAHLSLSSSHHHHSSCSIRQSAVGQVCSIYEPLHPMGPAPEVTLQVATSCMKSILPSVEVRHGVKHHWASHFEEMCLFSKSHLCILSSSQLGALTFVCRSIMIVEKRTSVTLIAIRKEFNRKYMVMKKEVFCILNEILSQYCLQGLLLLNWLEKLIWSLFFNFTQISSKKLFPLLGSAHSSISQWKMMRKTG